MSKENILMVADHPELPSGVGNKAEEIIAGNLEHFNWSCIGGNSNPTRDVEVFDSEFFGRDSLNETVTVYPHQGYANFYLFQKIVEEESIDKALFFGDPNNFYWLQNNIQKVDIQLYYYHVWDNLPVPEFNEDFYDCFDWIGAISLLTYYCLDEVYDGEINYVPHGADEDLFYPITENLSKVIENDNGKKTTEYQVVENIEKDWLNDKDFVLFWCNRNIQRKNAPDVIKAFKMFVDEYPPSKKDDFALIMKTNHKDPEGSFLPAVADKIAADCDIRILPEKVSPQKLNWYYNIADVTLNIANREGFGLTTLESLLAGTPIIVNVTGGLMDQCGFKDAEENLITVESDKKKLKYFVDKRLKLHGKWANPIWPEVQTISGTQQEPYCYDDYVNVQDVVSELKYVFMQGKEVRKNAGMKGRTFVMENFSKEEMVKGIRNGIKND